MSGFAQTPVSDDGYRLWLKYNLIKDAAKRQAYTRSAQFIGLTGSGPMLKSAANELSVGLQGLLGKSVPVINSIGSRTGGIVLRVVTSPDADSQVLAKEGYRISSKNRTITITGKNDAGVLYGAFALLRQIQTLQPVEAISLTSNPKVQFRMLNHWDNVDGTVERGYAGSSLWKWSELPERVDPRYRDYARANASLGINGTVVNNVNASARFMTAEYLQKVAALADVFRPYGIQVYLSVYFAAPKTLGG